MQGVNNAYVALIVNHYQVEEERQEEEIWEHVSHQTGAKT